MVFSVPKRYFFLIYLLAALGLRCCSGFSLVAASGGYSSLQCTHFAFGGFSSREARALGAGASVVTARAGSAIVVLRLQRTGSVVVVQALSCSSACGIFPDQGSNPCLLHQHADSSPMSHQPPKGFFFFFF